MDSSVSPKDEIWFLRVCHHISNAVYYPAFCLVRLRKTTKKDTLRYMVIWRWDIEETSFDSR